MSDFTEQARQLVERWLNEPSVRAFIRFTKDDQQSELLLNAVASALAEAATQGQVVGVERAAELAEKSHPQPCTCTTCLIHAEIALAIRKISPDPSYLNQIRNEAATAALEQAAKVKSLNRYILSDQVDGCDIVRDDDGSYLLYEDVIAAIGDDSEHGNRD